MLTVLVRQPLRVNGRQLLRNKSDAAMNEKAVSAPRVMLLPRHFLPDEGQLLPDDLIHLLLDQLQVSVGHLLLTGEKIVVESACASRYDRVVRRRPVSQYSTVGTQYGDLTPSYPTASGEL